MPWDWGGGSTGSNKESGGTKETGTGGREGVHDETCTLHAQLLEMMTRVTVELHRKLSEITVPSAVNTDIEKMSHSATTITRDSRILLASTKYVGAFEWLISSKRVSLRCL